MADSRFRIKFDSEVSQMQKDLKAVLKDARNLDAGTKSVGNEINRLSKAASNVRAYQKFSAELTENSQKLEKSKNRLKQLEQVFNQTKEPTMQMVRALHAAQDKADKLAQKNETLKGRTGDLSRSLDQEGISLKNLERDYEKVSRARKLAQTEMDAEIKKVRALSGAREAAKARYENVLNKSGSLAMVGHASMGWGKQVAGMAQAPVSTFLDFESKLSTLEAKGFSDKSKEERNSIKEMLKAEAMKHGAETSYSASQVLDAQIIMASAGIAPEDIKNAMGDVLNIAKATGVSLADAVEVSQSSISQFSGQFKNGFGDVAKVGDILAQTVKSAKIELVDVKETLKMAGLAAAESGVSFETMNAMIVAMARSNLKGSEAGTALRGMFTRLAKGTKESKEALSGLNVEVSKNGVMRDMKDILWDVSKAMEGKGNKEREALAAQIAGQEAMTGFLSLLKEARKQVVNAKDGTVTYENGLKSLNQTMKDSGGVAKTMTDIMKDNTQNSVDEMSASWEALSLTLVSNVKEPLNSLILAGKSTLDWVREFAEENPRLTNTAILLGGGIVGVTIAAGALLVPIATMGLLAGKAAFGFTTLARAIRGVNHASRANPIGIMFTAAQIALPWILSNLNWVWDKLSGIWDWASGIFGDDEKEKSASFDVNKRMLSEKSRIESAFDIKNLLNPENSGLQPALAGVPGISLSGYGKDMPPVKAEINKKVEIVVPEGTDTKEIIETLKREVSDDTDAFEELSKSKAEDAFSLMLDAPE